jgi:hypothetical protein
METYDDINHGAAHCTAFAGFFCMGEFTRPHWTATSYLTQISHGFIQFTSDDDVILHLPSSKTDQLRIGTSIPIAASKDIAYPVTVLGFFSHGIQNRRILHYSPTVKIHSITLGTQSHRILRPLI